MNLLKKDFFLAGIHSINTIFMEAALAIEIIKEPKSN